MNGAEFGIYIICATVATALIRTAVVNPGKVAKALLVCDVSLLGVVLASGALLEAAASITSAGDAVASTGEVDTALSMTTLGFSTSKAWSIGLNAGDAYTIAVYHQQSIHTRVYRSRQLTSAALRNDCEDDRKSSNEERSAEEHFGCGCLEYGLVGRWR